MDRDQQPPASGEKPEPHKPSPLRDHEGVKLGRDRPGEGLDTGVDTGAINPGQTGDNGKIS